MGASGGRANTIVAALILGTLGAFLSFNGYLQRAQRPQMRAISVTSGLRNGARSNVRLWHVSDHARCPS
jgi:hypothetical protein